VADGLSHREIAERLFISRRTVEVHVAHIRRKLGFSSQARIVAWILQHDRSPCEQGEGEGMRALPLSGEPLDDGRGRTR